jgi:hypothetical protein
MTGSQAVKVCLDDAELHNTHSSSNMKKIGITGALAHMAEKGDVYRFW